MKRIIIGAVIGLVLLGMAIIAFVAVSLNGTIKKGVETVGSKLTQVDVKLANVNLSVMSGSGKLDGLVIGNPPNYKNPSAIQVGSASLSVAPRSLFSDKVIVRSIRVEGPEITFETDLKGNNLSKIVSNLQASTGTGSAEKKPEPASTDSKSTKKLQVDEFLITGGKVHVSVNALGNYSTEVALPEIHLQNLGQGPDGITAAELGQKILNIVTEKAIAAATTAATDLAKGKLDLGKGLAITNLGNSEKITKGLGNLLKPKK